MGEIIHIWENGQRIIVDTRSLTEAISQKREHLNQERDSRVSAGMSWNGHNFDSDEASRLNLSGLVAAINAGIPLPADFVWRDADNVDVPMTQADIVAFAGAMLSHVSTLYAVCRSKKDSLALLTTNQEVDSVTFD